VTPNVRYGHSYISRWSPGNQKITKFLLIWSGSPLLPRDAMHKRGLCRHTVSVRLSVCHVRGFCQNVLKVFSQLGSHATLVFFRTKRHGNIPTGTPPPPNVGVECKQKNAILDEYLAIGFGSMTAAVRATTATVDRAVYGTDCRASANLIYHKQR